MPAFNGELLRAYCEDEMCEKKGWMSLKTFKHTYPHANPMRAFMNIEVMANAMSCSMAVVNVNIADGRVLFG